MIIKDQSVYALGAELESAIHVKTGEVIDIITKDCFDNQVTSEDYKMDCFDWNHVNPATGPLYIEGVHAGDVLKVEILDIILDDYGTMCAMPQEGVLGSDVCETTFKKVKVEDGYCWFNDLKLPLRPMIGVIGVAPKGEPIATGTPSSHGGNMDNVKITTGTILYLPVFHEGAYFACGDVHAAMGDGEVMGTGVEIAAQIRLRFDVIKNVSIEHPRMENDSMIYTIASDEDMEKAVYMATKEMCSVLQKHLGYTLNDAGMLMSLCGNLEICQVVDPKRTVRMGIPKTVCKYVL